jgi:heme ABC exporter ATP-binding subunit CcmA
MKAAIRVDGLEKHYGLTAALRGIGFELGPGQVCVLLGPNGSGKTTLLKILATLVRPDRGVVEVGGYDVRRQGRLVRNIIGVVGHQTYLYEELTVAENLRFYGRMYRVPELERRIREVAGLLGLEDRLETRVRALSRGFQQRAALARALLHDPPILLLDEPTTGLDADGRRRFGEILADLRTRGGTVLFSSHAFELERDWADRALVLSAGRLVFDGPAAGLDAGVLAGLLAGRGADRVRV